MEGYEPRLTGQSWRASNQDKSASIGRLSAVIRGRRPDQSPIGRITRVTWQAGVVQQVTADGGLDFFVSYTQADRAWAEWIAWQLEEDGHRVLIQAWDMVTGANWTHVMHEGLRRATRTIAVLSSAYVTSAFATAEWETAWRDDPLGEQHKLLVFRVMDCDRSGLLAGVVSVDLFGVTETVARLRLRDAATAAVTGRAKPASEPDFPPEARAVSAEPRFPGTLPDVWNVPPRNPNFTGRLAELGRIRMGLTSRGAVTVHALHGMGGVGKTQTAIEYAHRHANEYDLVWWVNAEKATAIGDQFTGLAAEIGLPPLADPEAILRAVHRFLRARSRWLLIFDNAESAGVTRPLLPGGAGHVLITTRRGGFRALGGVLDLDILDRPEAVALIRLRAPSLTENQADRLAAKLGDLPLALDQAAAYLDETGTPPDAYLGLLDSRSTDLRSRGHASTHPGTVATVWSVSIDKLEATEPAAIQLLTLCAWLAPEPIPLDLFTRHGDLLPEPLAAIAADPVAFNDAVGALASYSLARRTGGSLVIHRLIQEVTRHRAMSQTAASPSGPLQTVLALLRADLPYRIWATPANWPRWRALLPSVLSATSYHTGEANGIDTAWLLARAGTYLRSQGRYAEALPLHQRALRIREAVLGPDNPDVATALNYVGRALSDLGRAAEALPLYQRALRIREDVLSLDNPDVATALGNVGRALSDLDRAAEALPLHQRALRIDEAVFGPDHPDVATDLNHVGRALLDLGRAAEALPLLQRAQHIREATLGPDHPEVATILILVGRALSDLGRASDALPLYQRAQHIREATLGSDHPLTAQSRAYAAEQSS